jgi:hypothetical protein
MTLMALAAKQRSEGVQAKGLFNSISLSKNENRSIALRTLAHQQYKKLVV